jgi:hypothetical protein
MTQTIHYIPTEKDKEHMSLIRSFLEENGIPYEEDRECFGIVRLNEGKIELRYINSLSHRMDNSKRFGESCRGIPHDYFIRISHENFDKDIRTIWIFDFEMEQRNDTTIDGQYVRDFHRQWEVIKNTIRTATGHIHHRFYARDCEVREVPNYELRPFLETNCFYGYRSATKNLGLYLKKDRNGFSKGTLLMVYTFGYNFYGNKKLEAEGKNPFIEIIRVSTRLECQVIGGASKCLKHFCMENETLRIGERDVKVDELRFYVDASHNDARAMHTMGFDFVSWEGCGFMNMYTEDVDDTDPVSGKHLKGTKGEIFHRKPMYHKQIMRLIGEGKIISIANAGTQVYRITRERIVGPT